MIYITVAVIWTATTRLDSTKEYSESVLQGIYSRITLARTLDDYNEENTEPYIKALNSPRIEEKVQALKNGLEGIGMIADDWEIKAAILWLTDDVLSSLNPVQLFKAFEMARKSRRRR